MPKRYRWSCCAFFVQGLCWLLAALPAGGELLIDDGQSRFFAGLPATLVVHGPIADHRLVSVGEPSLERGGERWRVVLTLRTETSLGTVDQLAHSIELPPLPDAPVDLEVIGIDSPSGFSTTYLSRRILPEPALALSLDRHLLQEDETLRAKALFVGTTGFFAPTWQRLPGNLLRIGLEIGCHHSCPIPLPLQLFDLASPPLGGLAPGRYRVEIADLQGERSEPFFRDEILVLPTTLRLQAGRFAVRVELDPPHPPLARLASPPSADSALFYFFSPDNWELMVKLLDGCAINGHFWVFGAASTDVGYTVRVEDLAASGGAGAERTYRHEPGAPAPAITDIEAFDCATADAGDLR